VTRGHDLAAHGGRHCPPAANAEGVVRAPGGVYLYWIPLGAGGHSVGFNGKIYELIAALLARRRRRDLYHSALEVVVPDGTFVIEMTPIPDDRGAARGVVCEGPVGARWMRRFRLFRYEIRRWRDGVLPDADAAVGSPIRVTADPQLAERILELAPSLPTSVWGRDEMRAGEMWNSNSVIAWLLERGGVDTECIALPRNGRAPGWGAGRAVARRYGATEARLGPLSQRPADSIELQQAGTGALSNQNPTKVL
jgi:hypothetical protein